MKFDQLTLPDMDKVVGFMVVLDANTRWRLTLEQDQPSAGRKRTRNELQELVNGDSVACSHDVCEIGFDKDGQAKCSLLAEARRGGAQDSAGCGQVFNHHTPTLQTKISARPVRRL